MIGMNIFHLLMFLFLSVLCGCNNASYDQLREQATKGARRYSVSGDGPNMLFNKIYDRFGGTRPLVFGLEGSWAIKHRELFLEVIRNTPRAVLLERTTPEFLFRVSLSRLPDRPRVTSWFVMGNHSQNFINAQATLEVIAVGKVASGSQIILTESEFSICLDENVTYARPPSCADFLHDATIQNLNKIMN